MANIATPLAELNQTSTDEQPERAVLKSWLDRPPSFWRELELVHRSGAGGITDGYVDFDAALGGHSGGGVGILNPAYDSGDHIHPNIPGNAVMADLIPVGSL